MAFGTKLVHNMFLFQRTLGLEFRDSSRLLGKYGMAYFAIPEIFLVLAVRKMNVAPLTAIQFYFFGTLVFCRQRISYRGTGDQCNH